MSRYTDNEALFFLIVLVCAVIGAFIGLHLVSQAAPLQAISLNPNDGLQLVSALWAQFVPPTPPPRMVSVTRVPTRQPTAAPTPSLVIPTPVPPTPTPVPSFTPSAQATPPGTRYPTPTPAPPTPTPTPITPTPEAHYIFMPAGPIRHTEGGCPGPSIRGTVYDQAGNPLPGVRLWMYDQWANEAFAESKSGAIDLGQYDFPIFHNGPIKFYVTVLGSDGSPISPTVEVPHRQGPYPAANCHWLDWKRVR